MKIVAEIGLQHCGCLGTAYAFIDAAANAGADAVKFQCHDGDPVDTFRAGTWFPQDRTRADYWIRTGFTRDQWKLLRDRSRERGVAFGVSCFALEGVDLMRQLRPDFWKVPSGLVSDYEYLVTLAKTEVPVVLSSGMSTHKELHMALSALTSAGCREVTVLQCCSQYPTPPERIGLNMLASLRSNVFHTKVGISDHSGTIWPGLAAATLGADMLEVHVAWSRDQWGPDVPASITIDELRELTRGVRWIEKAMASPVDKDAVAGELSEMRKIFRRESA